MEEETGRSVPVEDPEPEEISESFLCCVCLELLYKPVVLSCGHISCFWCVHKSMSGAHESHCPICRRPYIYFPSICKMLHFLLVKMYPDAYKRRQIQILEEEKRIRTFSPQFDAHECSGAVETKVDGVAHSCTTVSPQFDAHECNGAVETKVDGAAHSCTTISPQFDAHECNGAVETKVDGVAHSCTTSVERLISLDAVSSRDAGNQEETAPQIKSEGNSQQISRSDLLCVSCKQLLFRPIVLNCGDVYCRSCLSSSANEKLKCQACQSLHPGELPEVCLELDHFLEEQFPEEYATKRRATEPSGDNSRSESSKASTPGTDKGEDRKSLLSGKVHFGVGCDYCGMYPIIGDRYRCMDCVEEIGFDLCGDCYNSRSKLPGRFNQQHKPEHKFQLVMPNEEHNYMLRLMTGIISSSGDILSENAPNASSPGAIVEEDLSDTEGSELDLTLPFVFDAIVEEDLSDTEGT